MLNVRHVSHNFGSHWALKNVSFELAKGEFLFLSGPSGAGKTTLLRLLYGSLPLERGKATVAGFRLHDLRRREIPLLRRQVSVVFQDFKVLAHRSVYDNIALALEVRFMPRRHLDRRVRAVARSLGLERRLAAPSGELSGGEQQRVAIARAIVVNPQLLLADEPTGNLDADLALRMLEIFQQFHTFGTTIILATHNRDLISRQPDARIVRLEEGQVVAANWPGGDPASFRTAATAAATATSGATASKAAPADVPGPGPEPEEDRL
ncbi:MAG: cell division ATP-binding protein FtsE [Desulfovibrionaceae bacterium]|jgi:cell division transport system ATP-binding protein|nr:cell division ATP-binding protein FtsE [Desulfovibrionaceae bacterium]